MVEGETAGDPGLLNGGLLGVPQDASRVSWQTITQQPHSISMVDQTVTCMIDQNAMRRPHTAEKDYEKFFLRLKGLRVWLMKRKSR